MREGELGAELQGDLVTVCPLSVLLRATPIGADSQAAWIFSTYYTVLLKVNSIFGNGVEGIFDCRFRPLLSVVLAQRTTYH